jgi:hypothetical protein
LQEYLLERKRVAKVYAILSLVVKMQAGTFIKGKGRIVP